jgi:hypothetical protein
MKLNKKQQIAGWAMLLLISLVILRIILILPKNPYFNSVRMFLSSYFLILISGFLSIYVLRDKKQ